MRKRTPGPPLRPAGPGGLVAGKIMGKLNAQRMLAVIPGSDFDLPAPFTIWREINTRIGRINVRLAVEEVGQRIKWLFSQSHDLGMSVGTQGGDAAQRWPARSRLPFAATTSPAR